MFVFYLVLAITGISQSTGAFVFTQKPPEILYAQEGSTANLTWTYTIDNRTAEMEVITWSRKDRATRQYVVLIVEEPDGQVKHNPNAPPIYGPEKVKVEGQASLVIKNVTFEDSTTYRCLLDGKEANDDKSYVDLIVTGKPVVYPLINAVKNGDSAIFTCNATINPDQNITWKRENEQNENLRIVNDGKYEITSSINGSQLTIKDVSSNDEGYYWCDTTAIGNLPSSGRGFLGLISLTKSNILCPDSNQKAHKGVPTTICCPIQGFPPPKVTWKMPDGTVRKTENTILPITPQEKDFGTYTCIADGLKQTVPDPIIVSIKLQKEEEKVQSAATTQGLSSLLGIALFMPFIKVQ